jgi:hypothetical protein
MTCLLAYKVSKRAASCRKLGNLGRPAAGEMGEIGEMREEIDRKCN